MTADAKIGLLLGLVFIFIIAFIINGLPSVWSHPNATPQVVKTTDNPGLAGTAQDAQKKLDWQTELSSVTTPPATTPATETAISTTVAKDATGPSSTTVSSLPLSPAAQTTLDDSIQKLVDMQKPAETATGASQTVSALVDTSLSQSSALNPAASTVKETLAPAAVKNDKTTAPSPTATTAKKETTKEYVVQEGDDLGMIAKKVYGSVGKNPDLIYTYNRAVLKSKDVITVGQKLKIPPLPTTTAKTPSPTKPANVLPGTQFEPVSGIGTSTSKPPVTKAVEISQSTKPSGTSTTATSTDGRWYVVQADDNLWKISTKQLGNGARFQEIVKLNAAILKNKDSVVTPGMRLKMPAK
jgi:nucleoid-associated protein YgaU